MLPPTSESQTAELAVVVDILNECCEEFHDTKDYLPLNTSNVYDKMGDGVVLARIANLLAKDLLPNRLIKSPAISAADKDSNLKAAQKAIEKKFQKTFANFNHFVSGAALAYLNQDVCLAENISVIRTLKKGEGLNTILHMPSNGILKRWINYHLQRAGQGSEVTDIQLVTLEQMMTLLRQLDNKNVIGKEVECTAKGIIEASTLLELNRFITIDTLTKGHTVANVAFLTHVFNNKIGIFLPTEEEMDHIMNELRTLKQKLSTCEADCIVLDKEIAKLEKEIEDLKELEKYNEYKTLENQLEKLKAKRQIYSDETKATLDELNKKSIDLTTKMEELNKIHDGLKESIKDQGEEFAAFTEKLNEATNGLNDKSRAIQEHTDKLGVKFVEWGNNLEPNVQISIEKAETDATQLENCLNGQTEMLKKYQDSIKDIDDKFERQKQDSKKRIDEINALVSEYLGTGDTNAGDAIVNMKKLLELMIEKCKKQSKQISTYDLTIEKMDDLNVLMDTKIKYYAQKNIRKKTLKLPKVLTSKSK